MASRESGRAHIRILPDTRNFAQELKKQLAAIQQTYTVDVEPDLSTFEGKVRAVLDAMKDTATVNVEADTEQATKDINDVADTHREAVIDVVAGGTTIANDEIDHVARERTATIDVDVDKTAVATAEGVLQALARNRSTMVTPVPFSPIVPPVVAPQMPSMPSMGTGAAVSSLAGLSLGLSQVSLISAGVVGAVGAVGAAVAGIIPVTVAAGQTLITLAGSLGMAGAAAAPAAIGAVALSVAALKTAVSGMGEALKAENVEAFNAAIAGMSPAAQEAARGLRDVKESYSGFTNDVQESFWGQFDNIGKLENLTFGVSSAVQSVAADFGLAGKNLVGFLTAGNGLMAFHQILEGATNSTGSLAASLQNALRGVVLYGGVGAPIFATVTQQVEKSAQSWARQTELLYSTGVLHQQVADKLGTLQEAYKVTKDVTVDVWQSMTGVFRAAGQAAEGATLPVITALDYMNTWVNSDVGQASLVQFFVASQTAVGDFLPLLGQLAQILGTEVIPMGAAMVTELAPGVSALLTGLGDGLDRMGPGAVTAARGISDLAASVAPALGPIGQILGDTLQVIGTVASSVGDMAEPLVPVVGVVAHLTSGFADLVDVLGGATGPMLATVAAVAALRAAMKTDAVAGFTSELRQQRSAVAGLAVPLAASGKAADKQVRAMGRLTQAYSRAATPLNNLADKHKFAASIQRVYADQSSKAFKTIGFESKAMAHSVTASVSRVGAVVGGVANTAFTPLRMAATGSVNVLKKSFQGLQTQATALYRVLESHSPTVARMGQAYVNAARPLENFRQRQLVLAGQSRVMAAQSTGAFRTVGLHAAAMAHTSIGAMARMGAAMRGFAAGAMAGLKSGAKGLMGLFGGPWGLALMAGSMAVSSAITGFKNMNTLLAESRGVANRAREAYSSMFDAILHGGDKLSSAEQAISSFQDSLNKRAEANPGMFHRGLLWVENQTYGRMGYESEYMREGNKAVQQNDAAVAAQKAMQELGLSTSQLAEAATGSDAQYQQLRDRLTSIGEGGEYAAQELDTLREAFINASQAAERIGPAGMKAAAAIEDIADKAGTAEDRADKLRLAFLELAGVNISAEEASAQLTKTLENLSQSMEKVHGAQLSETGFIDTTTSAGAELYGVMNDLHSAMVRAVSSGGDANEVFARSTDELENMRAAAGLGKQEWDALLQKMGMTPEQLTVLAQVNSDPAKAELASVQQLFKDFEGEPVTKNFIVKDENARQTLQSFGLDVQEVMGGAEGEVTITMNDQEAKEKLDWFIHVGMPNLDGKNISMQALMDTTQLEGSATHAQQIIDALAIENPSPSADLLIDKLKAGNDLAMGELAALAAESPTPVADLDKKLLDAGVLKAGQSLKDLDSKRPTPHVKVSGTAQAVKDTNSVKSALNALKSKTIDITVNRITRWFGGGGETVSGAGPRGGGGGSFSGGFARGGRLPAYASGHRHTGYQLPFTGAGTDVVDGFLAFDRYGVPAARLDAGEWVINRNSSKRYSRELAQINAGTFPKLPGYQNGGRHKGGAATIDEESLLAWLDGNTVNGIRPPAGRSLNGFKYTYGGGGTEDWGDCSFTQSLIVGMILGLWRNRPLSRLFATGNQDSVLRSLGFNFGRKTGPGIYSVGWVHNGLRSTDHTSGTVGTTNVEMGGGAGGNGKIGGAAAGSMHPQYNRHAWIELLPSMSLSVRDAAARDSDARDSDGWYDDETGMMGGREKKKGISAKDIDSLQDLEKADPTRASTWSAAAGIVAKTAVEGQVKGIFEAFGISDDLPPAAKALQKARAFHEEAFGSPDDDYSISKEERAAEKAREQAYEKAQKAEEKLPLAEAELKIAKQKRDETYTKRDKKGNLTASESTRMSADLRVQKAEEKVAELKAEIATAKHAKEQGYVQPPYDPNKGASQWRPTIMEALRRMGQSSKDADRTEKQIQIESGGNPRAVNNWDINAKNGDPSGGLLQVIGATYRAMRQKYAREFAGTVDDRFHPLTNIMAGIGWTLHAYGSLANKWPTTKGYASGGRVFGAGGSREDKIPAVLSHGEFVVNSAATARYWPLLERINRGKHLEGDGGNRRDHSGKPIGFAGGGAVGAFVLSEAARFAGNVAEARNATRQTTTVVSPVNSGGGMQVTYHIHAANVDEGMRRAQMHNEQQIAKFAGTWR